MSPATTALASAENVPRVLVRLRNYWGATDTDIARVTGIGRRTVANKVSGHTEATASELALFAAAFGVDVTLFYLDPTDAVRWVLDHEPAVTDAALLEFRNRCLVNGDQLELPFRLSA